MSINSNIKELINIVNKKISEINNTIINRERKILFGDILYFLSQTNGKSISYDIANANLKCNNILNVSKTAIIKQKNKFDHSQIRKLNDHILKYIYKKKTVRYIAVDGSQINLPKSLKDNYQLNKHKTYCSALMSTLFDVDLNMPINTGIYKSFNERETLIDQLNYVNKKDVLIMDRGYYSDNLLKTLVDKDIDAIFRLKSNSRYVKMLGKLNEIVIKKNIKGKIIKLKIVKYEIKKREYYLCSTLINKPLTFLKDAYWKRWNVETNFRSSKYDLSLSQIKSKSVNSIKQTIAITDFIQIIVGYIEDLLKDKIDINSKINRKNDIYQFIDKLIYIFLYEKNNKKTINKILKILTVVLKTITIIVKDRKYRRVRKSPSSKWCLYGNTFIRK